MHSAVHLTFRYLIAIAILSAASTAHAQETQTGAPPTPLTRAEIEARITRIQDNQALDEATKARITDLYRQALIDVQAATDSRTRANEWNASRDSAPDRIRELEALLLSASDAEMTDEDWSDRPMAELTQASTFADEQLAQARRDLGALEAEA